MNRLVYKLIGLFVVIALLQLMWHLSVLPEKIASHFDAQGNPDGFMSRREFGLLNLALIIGLPALMVGSGKLCYVLPDNLINMPHPEYWLHPDRRLTTLKSIESSLGWICVGTQVFLIAVQQLVFESNRSGGPLAIVPFITFLAIYLLGISFAVIMLLWKFRLPAQET